MLTQEQVDFYNENGYLKVNQLFKVRGDRRIGIRDGADY